jgi:6,7-dimethyl-8-ribityllumazine synthase
MSMQAPHCLILDARFYDHLADKLVDGATSALKAAGATYEVITLHGALEIPPAIAMAAGTGAYDGFIALGCVIRGETSHYDIVANESARGLMELGIREKLAIGNGILTVEDEAQALRRADKTELDKGGFAARACLEMIRLRHRWLYDAGK